jgi:hypothetical protein
MDRSYKLTLVYQSDIYKLWLEGKATFYKL